MAKACEFMVYGTSSSLYLAGSLEFGKQMRRPRKKTLRRHMMVVFAYSIPNVEYFDSLSGLEEFVHNEKCPLAVPCPLASPKISALAQVR